MNIFEKRLDELLQESNAIELSKKSESTSRGGSTQVIDNELFEKWRVKIKRCIVDLCGADSEYYKEIEIAEKTRTLDSYYAKYKRIKPVFLALYEDFKSGYVERYKKIIQSEVFSDQLDQAEELYNAGYYIPAALISGIVLETKLRELVLTNGLETGKLDKMNADLVKKGVYNTLVQKQITAIAAIRNSAAHGKYDDFTKEQVRTMLDQIVNILGFI